MGLCFFYLGLYWRRVPFFINLNVLIFLAEFHNDVNVIVTRYNELNIQATAKVFVPIFLEVMAIGIAASLATSVFIALSVHFALGRARRRARYAIDASRIVITDGSATEVIRPWSTIRKVDFGSRHMVFRISPRGLFFIPIRAFKPPDIAALKTFTSGRDPII